MITYEIKLELDDAEAFLQMLTEAEEENVFYYPFSVKETETDKD
jgi:hypothetical protein